MRHQNGTIALFWFIKLMVKHDCVRLNKALIRPVHRHPTLNSLLGLVGVKYLILNDASSGYHYLKFKLDEKSAYLTTFSCSFHRYRWVPLKSDFLGAWKSVLVQALSSLSNNYNKFNYQRNLATKIRAKQESSLTAVQLKQDPPV